MNGMKIHSGGNNIAAAELLDNIQRYVTQRRAMQRTEHVTVPFTPVRQGGFIFLSGDLLGLIIDDMTVLRLMRLPSPLRGVTEGKWELRHGLHLSHLVMEDSQDLLVLTEKRTG